MGIWDLEQIKHDLDEAEVETNDFDEVKTQKVYLGSVFHLYPSGKFYTPWSNSHLEVCVNCRKAGDNIPCDDEHPCIDPFPLSGIQVYHDRGKTIYIVSRKTGPNNEDWENAGSFITREEAEEYIREHVYHCEFCRDMKWLHEASAELETIGACLESGEGDPCDLYATRVLETKQ